MQSRTEVTEVEVITEETSAPSGLEAGEAAEGGEGSAETTTIAGDTTAKEPGTEATPEPEPTTARDEPELAMAEPAEAQATEPEPAEAVADAGDAAGEGPASEPVTTAAPDTNGEITVPAGHRPSALPTWWTEAYPQVSDVRTATAYLDALGGAMSRREENGRWVLWTGEQALFEADTQEELDGFVLGFALSQLISERHGPIAHARRN